MPSTRQRASTKRGRRARSVRAAGGKPKPTPGSDSDGDASARKVPESASDSEATPPPPAGRANSKSKSKSKSKSQGKGKGKGNGNGRGKSQRAPAREQPQPRRPVKRRRGGGGFGGGGGGGGAPAAGPTPTPEEVLEAVRTALATPAELAATAPTLESLGISGVVEVRERQGHDVVDSIEYIIANAALQILAGKGFTFSVPNRGASNQLYVPELDRIVLRDRRSVRPFVSTSTVRKTTIMTRVMQLIHQILLRRIHVTKRDLFYTDVKLFKDQRESDGVLDDISCMVGCTRTSLNVVASEKGIVIGRVTFRDDGDLIDCARMGVGGKAIPPFVDRITDIQSDAEFILLVEKDAAFMRLAEDRFYNKYRCIIITAKGQPDVATRLFLKRLKAQLNIPVFGLVDSDPYGLKILSVYMNGSKAMSYDSASLTTPDIKWLGVRPSDLDRYNIPQQCRLPMTASDLKTGRELLKEEFVQSNKQWSAELELMIETQEKAEIQALSSFGFQFLTEVYLPQKLANKDWI